MKKPTPEYKNEWTSDLTEEQYAVLIDKETEPPFTGKYLYETREGIYLCVVCGNTLFSSDAKFDSGTGWPSFDDALPGAVETLTDNSLGMDRLEVVCTKCGSHLGHLFDDESTETGKRYCLNSICLDLNEDNQ